MFMEYGQLFIREKNKSTVSHGISFSLVNNWAYSINIHVMFTYYQPWISFIHNMLADKASYSAHGSCRFHINYVPCNSSTKENILNRLVFICIQIVCILLLNETNYLYINHVLSWIPFFCFWSNHILMVIIGADWEHWEIAG